MKTINYPLETIVQEATIKNKNILVDSFKTILDSNKDHMRKADYIAYAITSIDTRVQAIDEQLEHLLNLKKRLQTSKDLALEAAAIALNYYGIAKLEGSAFESITVSKAIQSTKQRLVVTNEDALIAQGFFKYKKVLDKQRVMEEYIDGVYKKFIELNTRLENVFIEQKSKLVVNKRVMHDYSSISPTTGSDGSGAQFIRLAS